MEQNELPSLNMSLYVKLNLHVYNSKTQIKALKIQLYTKSKMKQTQKGVHAVGGKPCKGISNGLEKYVVVKIHPTHVYGYVPVLMWKL